MPRTKLRFGRPTTTPPVVKETYARTARTSCDDDENRRNHPRLETSGQARVTLDGQDYQVIVTDMGNGGLRCHPLPYWIRRGDPILVLVSSVPLVGRVAWRRPLSDSNDDLLVGVRFSRPHPELIRVPEEPQ